MNIFKNKEKLYGVNVETKETLKEDDVVSCNNCRCLVLKDEAQEVNYDIPMFGKIIYYCRKCEKPYSKITVDLPMYQLIDGKEHTHYWALLEVDEKGKLIKENKK